MNMISWQMTEVNKPIIKVESPMPTPGQGEVLLRVAGCGVCHTDLGFLLRRGPDQIPDAPDPGP